VDGAYGASVALSTKHRYLAKDLQHCDSLTWDAHKWLFQTYGCGIVFFKNKRHLTDTFRVNAEYIQDAAEGSEEFPNFWNYGPEWTRPARAMKLWFSLKLIGLDVLGSMIDQGILLAERAEAELRRLPGWQVLSQSKLGIVCFRFVADGKSPQEVDALNRQISRRAIELNIAAPLTTRLRGTVCLRICSIHPDLICQRSSVGLH
jgi:glutamate/tyrosine decarboxylase-like PLP-dependent enzyme